MDYISKKQKLLERISQLTENDIVLAFSGGVDSSLLLKLCCEAAKENGSRVFAVTVHTKLHPVKDLEIAGKVADEAGAQHLIIDADELEEAGIENNPVDRCYLCKRCIFRKINSKAEELGASAVVEGTNEDDLHVYRPGIKALQELEIISPLAEAGITKDEVRRMAAEYGISVADRPSTPCMATRFTYGSTLSYEALRRVDEGEEWLRSRGFYNVRLRVHGDILRIEVDRKDLELVLRINEELIAKMRELGFVYITLDLEGFRSGSMDIGLD